MERGSKQGPQAKRIVEWCKRLKGHKRLVLGNHDHFPVGVYVDAGFEKVRGCWGGFEGFMLTHIPVHPDSLGRGKVNIHGHIHERVVMRDVAVETGIGMFMERAPDPRYINVCVEQIDYRPVSLDELRVRAGFDVRSEE